MDIPKLMFIDKECRNLKLVIDGGTGGFRGGDLVTCHPLFSDMTLQSQILVIESLFLTSVSKFIRKYLLSDNFHTCTSLALIPLFPLSNLATMFFRKNYR